MFPNATPNFTTPTSSETLQAAGHTALHVAENSNIVAIATKLGIGSSTPTSNTALIGNGIGTSAWGQVALSNMVFGVLPTTNGGTGTTATTGTGSVVFNNLPTLINPTLTNPTESGGTYNTATLNAPTINYSNNSIPAGILESGSVNFADLLSTIFSGQVTSYSNGGSAGGTFYYINLGGIKMLWGVTNTFTISGSGAQASGTGTITFPVGFFNSIQSLNTSIGSVPSGTSSLFATLQGLNGVTSMTVIMNQTLGGSGAAGISVFVIGT